MKGMARTTRDLMVGLWWVLVVNYVPGTFPWAVVWWAMLFGAGLLVGWWTA